jgi:nucleoside-specific outer membrane channel protein Tsx
MNKTLYKANIMKLKTIASLILIPTMALSATTVSAKQFWSDYSITALTGSDYLNPFTGATDDRNVVTIEHASGHTWGSTFFFMDRLTNPDDLYGEINLNPTLYKMDGDGFVKEIFLGLQAEFGSGETNQNNFLYGVGASLNVPYFKYFNVAYYRRNQDSIGIDRGDNNQVTVTWRVDEGNVRYDGFLDIVDEADNMFGGSESGYNFTSQLKYNVGPMMGVDSGRLDVGVEYIYWKNKFGVDGQTENNINLLAKWHF